MGNMRNAYVLVEEILKAKDYSEDLNIDGRIILRLMLHGVDWIQLV
jgi:hypothetical protein